MNPLPSLEGYSGEFYAFCGKGELRFQRCTACGTWRHPPRPMCGACNSLNWEWARSQGRGTIYTWTVVHQALDPALADQVPYAAVIVALAEGPRLATWVSGVAPDDLQPGMAVEVWFDPIDDAHALPKFRPLA